MSNRVTFVALVAFVGLSNCHAAPAPIAPPPPPPVAPVAAADLPVAVSPPSAVAPVVGFALARPPVALTASDGTGLKLVALEGSANVEEPLAFTEMHLTFENPEDRRLEGTFRITLPQGATVSRFAMKIDGAWQEGEVVELMAARQAYEDFLHRKQDPALLEQAGGNEFSARVFPILPRAQKEIIISYSQELAGAPYTLPLRGFPELGKVDLSLSVGGGGAPMQALHEQHFVPTADFVMDPKLRKSGDGLRSQNLVLARVRPQTTSRPEPFTSQVVLFDTSASRALGFADQLQLLKRYVARVAEARRDLPISIACFDQTTESVFEGPASAFGDAELARIKERRALGASNVEQALVWARDQAKKIQAKRVVIVSDGVATAGEVAPDKLASAAEALTRVGVERLDAIAVGGIRDDAGLRRLVKVGLAHDGVVADGSQDMGQIARRLTEATRSGLEVKVDGARWFWPRRLDGVQAGDEISVYADVPEGQPVRISVGGGAPSAFEVRAVERPLLERAWVQAKIGSLVDRLAIEPSHTAEIKKEIVGLSVSKRVLSPYTALLVLETENDYARFGIDRRSLVDILTIEGGRVALTKRGFPAGFPSKNKADDGVATSSQKVPSPDSRPGAPPPPPPPPSARGRDASGLSARGNMWGESAGDSFGAGGLGLSGVGAGGGGRGEGIGLGNVGTLGRGAGAAPAARAPARPSPAPTSTSASPSGDPLSGVESGHGRLGGSNQTRSPSLRQGATQINGRVPPEIIQRIVRQNFGRFRLCYENGLRTDATLSGRVSVRFVIDTSGAVVSAGDAGSDLPDQGVVQCVVRSFASLKFPQPEGGNVTVVYPITFNPGDDSASAGPSSPGSSGDPSSPARAADPYVGRFKSVMDLVGQKSAKAAVAMAFEWREEDPGDVTALVALGEALEADGDLRAARAYGSIVDLFSNRADLRRFAGERLERLKGNAGLDLAIDTYAKAKEQRPDHPAGHRLLAYARLKKGDYSKAFDAALAGIRERYPRDRFPGVDRILREDLGLIAAAWARAEPAKRAEISARTIGAGAKIDAEPTLRFILNWETDANDVDFHIYDGQGGHAFFSQPDLPSGGHLYADVTTGYGPECFTIHGKRDKKAPPYTLQAHYYSRGPMGYGMGKLEIIDHDGKGNLTFEERPFVVMTDRAFVDLGTVNR